MKNVNLYNQDGSLCSEAQPLISSKPDNVSRADWMKTLKTFRDQLSPEDLKEFERLRRCTSSAKWTAENPDYQTIWRTENPDYPAIWRAENPEKVKKTNAKWRAENPEAENPEKQKEYNAKWYAENTERAKEHTKRSQRKQRKKPENKLRSTVSRAFKRMGQNKPTNTLKLLGCTWEEAKAHFESLFLEGMTWENHGEWHIDHIRPVASFKGASEEELKQMNHISNLQPLWATDNLSKSDKWDGELNSGILNSEV